MKKLVAVGVALLLVACARSPIEPTYECIGRADWEICGRGGGCNYPCIRYKVTCDEPLTLEERNNKLECHLSPSSAE